MRTSQDTAIIQTSSAPICGAMGAARAAQYQAAIETIKAGYDRYIIVNAASANNVSVTQLPGSYQTNGTIINNGSTATLNASTTYHPGPLIVAGTHDEGLMIKMFKNGQLGADQSISAREILGPEWKKAVKNGVHTCAE
jgi:hypothetical protein